MRKLGLIGGMSWVSTALYYERINRFIQKGAGPMASAPLLIESLDFTELHGLNSDEDWSRATEVLVASAKRLQDAGAEALLIGANSMHRVYRDIEAEVDVEIIHIAECVGMKLKASGIKNVALLGTRNVMTEGFYRRRLVAHGIDILPPDMGNVETLDRIIYDQLMVGKIRRDSERALKTIITNKEQEGADAIVLACTELDLIVDTKANVLPVFDSTVIHCEAAAEWILGSDEVN
ncbi:aspartate/glutamate racemase family protein [Erythrobacter sp. YT30]|uniref:aspartate/glutamate racemase family protein n=1 Tax=Erythrobacter sp. YT30 TaxID=1735012 RepID=UPI00076CEF7D|nr:amino acid racemase [Erythrobacter sp. YT30]KWV90503.1 aspartate racemase [Erythrobacter sp. YT30]